MVDLQNVTTRHSCPKREAAIYIYIYINIYMLYVHLVKHAAGAVPETRLPELRSKQWQDVGRDGRTRDARLTGRLDLTSRSGSESC